MAALELAARERVDVGDTDLVTAGVLELGRMIRTGETSPVEITKACLSRIERIDSKLNSFITVTAEAALAQAAAVEAELAAGLDRGPFHGIPYALKDNVDTAGVLSSSHSRIFIDRVPQDRKSVV